MNLDKYPDLLSKTHLGKIFGVSVWTIHRRMATPWRDNFEWFNDGGKLKATRDSVQEFLNKGIERTRCRMTAPTLSEI